MVDDRKMPLQFIDLPTSADGHFKSMTLQKSNLMDIQAKRFGGTAKNIDIDMDNCETDAITLTSTTHHHAQEKKKCTPKIRKGERKRHFGKLFYEIIFDPANHS